VSPWCWMEAHPSDGVGAAGLGRTLRVGSDASHVEPWRSDGHESSVGGAAWVHR
jgi:hypothetical protein